MPFQNHPEILIKSSFVARQVKQRDTLYTPRQGCPTFEVTIVQQVASQTRVSHCDMVVYLHCWFNFMLD